MFHICVRRFDVTSTVQKKFGTKHVLRAVADLELGLASSWLGAWYDERKSNAKLRGEKRLVELTGGDRAVPALLGRGRDNAPLVYSSPASPGLPDVLISVNN